MKNKSTNIRLLLIKNSWILRTGILSILKKHLDISIITESGKHENTVNKIHRLKPNVILIDLGLRSQYILGVAEQIKKEFPASKINVMDLVPLQSEIHRFVNADASGFILKDTTLDEFPSFIRTVAKGTKVLPSNLNESLFSQIIENALKSGNVILINAVKIIDHKMGIFVYNVKNLIRNIIEKLALRTRIESSDYSPGFETFKTISESISIFLIFNIFH